MSHRHFPAHVPPFGGKTTISPKRRAEIELCIAQACVKIRTPCDDGVALLLAMAAGAVALVSAWPDGPAPRL